MPAAEPSLPQFSAPFSRHFLRYFLATRPAFLTVTLAACLIGLASAYAQGVNIDPLRAGLTLFFALVAHAGVNVVNDYYDALNGSDAANQERCFPFTGGSRFIQNGVLTLRQAALLGYGLLAAVIPAGLWLTAHSAPGLIGIGLLGLLLGWAYSAPPLKLMCRGLGEIAIVGGWLLVVVGTDFVQRGSLGWLPVLVGLPYALLVANILFINQFPDARADASAGKNTLVVKLGPEQAKWGYLAIALFAYGWLILFVGRGALPVYAAAGALPLALSFNAGRELLHHASEPAALVPAIQKTIAAANLSGLLLALGLAFSRLH